MASNWQKKYKQLLEEAGLKEEAKKLDRGSKAKSKANASKKTTTTSNSSSKSTLVNREILFGNRSNNSLTQNNLLTQNNKYNSLITKSNNNNDSAVKSPMDQLQENKQKNQLNLTSANKKESDNTSSTKKTTKTYTTSDGYTYFGKNYGDYWYRDYSKYKDLKVFTKDGKYYVQNGDKYEEVGTGITGTALTSKEQEKKDYKTATKDGHKYNTKLSVEDQLKLDSANLTKKQKEEYTKDLQRQAKDKEEDYERKNQVRYGGAGLKGSLGEAKYLIGNAVQKIDDEVVEPVRDIKDNYDYGKKSEELMQEAYKKMTGKKNNYESLKKELDTYTKFNKDIAENGNYLDQTLQSLPTTVGGQIEGIKGGGPLSVAGAILGGAVGGATKVGIGKGAVAGAKLLGGAGYVGGQAKYTYELEAGAQYMTLLDMGVPEDIAKKEAKKTGLISAGIESGESILDLVSFGQLTAVKTALTKNLIKEYGEETVSKWVGTTVLRNTLSEGAEEGLQETNAILSEKRATEEAGIKRDSSEDLERIKESAIVGSIGGFIGSGAMTIAGAGAKTTINTIKNNKGQTINEAVTEQIDNYEKENGSLDTKTKEQLIKETEQELLNQIKTTQNTENNVQNASNTNTYSQNNVDNTQIIDNTREKIQERLTQLQESQKEAQTEQQFNEIQQEIDVLNKQLNQETNNIQPSKNYKSVEVENKIKNDTTSSERHFIYKDIDDYIDKNIERINEDIENGGDLEHTIVIDDKNNQKVKFEISVGVDEEGVKYIDGFKITGYENAHNLDKNVETSKNTLKDIKETLKSNENIKNIEVEESNASNSKYLNIELNNGENISVRLSDHKRPSYQTDNSVSAQDWNYDIEEIDKNFNFDKEKLIQKINESINEKTEDTQTQQDINNNTNEHKNKQLDIINNNNPMEDENHTGIRSVNDIKTFEEAINDEESFVYGDYSLDDAKRDLQKGTVTVYSSKPIEQGGFVSTSKNMAKDYAGNGKVYSKEVSINDVAWINGDEGQYAKVDTQTQEKTLNIAPTKQEVKGFNEIKDEEVTVGNDALKLIAPIKQELEDLRNELQKTVNTTKKEVKSLTSEINKFIESEKELLAPTKEQNDTKYSISDTDNKGRKLSSEDKEWSKNSTERDGNGNLKEKYHGTTKKFTKFDKSKAKSSGEFGNGFYFTDDIDTAQSDYGNVMKVYLNIENPLIDGGNRTISKEQIKKLVTEIANNEDYGIENYGYDATIDSVTNMLNEHLTDFQILNDLNLATVGNFAELLEYANNTIGTNYDAIKNYRQTMVLNENQIKIINHEKSTDIAPTKEQNDYYNANYSQPEIYDNEGNVITETDSFASSKELPKMVESDKEVKKTIQETLGVTPRQASDVYKSIVTIEDYDINDVKNAIDKHKNIVIKETNQELKDLKKILRKTPIDISYLKTTDPNFSEKVREAFGSLRLVNKGGRGIDVVYQELQDMYPGFLPKDLINSMDMLNKFIEISKTDANIYYKESIPEDVMNEYANTIYDSLNGYKTYKEMNDRYKEFKQSTRNMVAPPIPEDTSPVENPVFKAPVKKEIIPENTLDDIDLDKGAEVFTKNNVDTTDNPIDNYVDNLVVKQTESKPRQKKIDKKSSLKDQIDLLRSGLTNRNVEIDKTAKRTGNKFIKFYGDQLNNIHGELGANINNVQTNNNGETIGKGIEPIFKQARDNKLEEAFNDYLFHLSNIARHKQGKGSKVELKVSEKMVKGYDKVFPEMKKWAEEVNTYNRNNLYKQVNGGLISQELADKIVSMYDFYVPFFEEVSQNYFPQDKYELKTKSTVKKATGGAEKETLMPFEESMINQTVSTIRAIRKNQLYSEIIKSEDNTVDLGADFRNGTNDLSDSLYQDETGYYLTGYENGERITAKIDENLFKELQGEFEQKLKDIENKASIVFKPLQKASVIKRNLLTTWNPLFAITNTIRDFQDAVFNSKHTLGMLKNYVKSVKGITAGKGKYLDEFLNLYGDSNLMGDYNMDSGTSKATDIVKEQSGRVKKNAKRFGTPAGWNEIAELVPRYAEYVASREAGETPIQSIYNAREVTLNFGRGGTLTKFINRNGFTFLNTSVQGASKIARNFTEDGVKGAVKSSIKLASLGVVPALANALMLGGDDDEDYEALPQYVKDNYYLFKVGDGNFIRIPKGRILTAVGSLARRMLEAEQGKENAFEGYLKNAWSQIGVTDPMGSNILAPIIQANKGEFGESWFGGDIVPSRLQNKPKEEQTDASIDAISNWIGETFGVSPYKANYILDQYTGGWGDILIPMITPEAQSDNDTLTGIALAPFKDKFTVDSTTDNKYVSEFYDKSDKLEVTANGSKATKLDKLKSTYMTNVSYELGDLYKEMREVQADKNLSKSQKYKKAQAIKSEINKLAQEGLSGYEKITKYGDYASIGGTEYRYYTDSYGNEKWTKPTEKELNELNSMGLTIKEKDTYYKTKNKISTIKDNYENTGDYTNRKLDIVKAIKNSGLNDDTKYYLYKKNKGMYESSKTIDAMQTLGVSANEFMDYASTEFTADKDKNGKSINGSKKEKVFNYINNMNISYEDKLILAKLQYNSYDDDNYEIIDYLNQSPLSYEEMEDMLKLMGFEVDKDGNIEW